MTGHGVLSVSKKERVITVKCQCGDTFDSIESEALARAYLARHIRHIEGQVCLHCGNATVICTCPHGAVVKR